MLLNYYNKDMKKILVTGGSGFIGSAFIRRVLKCTNYTIRALVRNTNQRNLERLYSFSHVRDAINSGRLHIIYGDLLGDLSGLCEECNYVVHFAAKTFVDHCYSSDTEVLTKRGWLKWRDTKENDEIATRSDKGFFEWQKPIRLYRSKYEGKMISIKSRSLDLLVTPNHRMFGTVGRNISGRNHEFIFEKAEKFLQMERKRLGLPFRIPTWSTWTGTLNSDEHIIPDRVDKFGKFVPGGKIPLATWVALIGIYIAEGYCSNPEGYTNHIVGICQEKSSKDFNKIKELLDSTPWKWNYQGHQFCACLSRTLYYELENLGKSYSKRIPSWIKELPSKYLEILLNWAVIGDGCTRPDGARKYYTCSEALADDIQEIIQKLGRHSTKKIKPNDNSGAINDKPVKKRRTLWQILERTSDWTPVTTAEEIDYNDEIYCAEVENGVMLVRRNGFPSWCGNSIRDPLPFIEANVMGTYKLLEDARRNKVERYIQASTDEVYGAILDGAYTENSRINPTNPYSATKAGGDALTICYSHTFGMHTIVTRTENNFGFYQHPQKAFPVFTKMAMNNEQLPVYGDGKHSRQWLWVDDHVDGILLLLTADINPGEVFHVAGSQELTNIDLAKKIIKACGKEFTENSIKYIPDHVIRPGHDRRYALVCDKLRSLGWKPKVGLDEGIQMAVDWYRDNPSWTM